MSFWEELRPEGASGHVQRVATAGEHVAYTPTQTAYRAYSNHGATCVDCVGTRCTVSDELWQEYAKAKATAEADR